MHLIQLSRRSSYSKINKQKNYIPLFLLYSHLFISINSNYAAGNIFFFYITSEAFSEGTACYKVIIQLLGKAFSIGLYPKFFFVQQIHNIFLKGTLPQNIFVLNSGHID